MDRKRWTSKEVKYLVKNYMYMSDKELGEALNRTTTSITAKRHDLGIYKGQWTDEEDKELSVLFWKEKTDKEIAMLTKRTPYAVHKRRLELGLHKKEYWNHEEDKELTKLFYEGLTDEEIGVALNRTKRAVTLRRHALKLDIHKRDKNKKYVYRNNRRNMRLVGTFEELSKALELTEKTLKQYEYCTRVSDDPTKRNITVQPLSAPLV